jgi:hypothetical protein
MHLQVMWVLTEANGDLSIIGKKLDLGDSYFSYDDEVYVVFVNPKKGFKFDMANGNEMGAYKGLWVPGGYTANGTMEAVLLNSESLLHNNSWNELLKFYGTENVKPIK